MHWGFCFLLLRIHWLLGLFYIILENERGLLS